MLSSPATADEPTSVWGAIARFVFAMLEVNINLLVAIFPILFVIFAFSNPLQVFLALGLALVLSAPGLAAAFAAFRDCPSLRSSLRDRGKSSFSTPAAVFSGAIARSYWGPDEDSLKVFAPFWRAYRQVAKRAALVSVPLALFSVATVMYMELLQQVSWAVYVLPTLAVLLLLAVGTWLPILVMVVEFPQAKIAALVRNGLYLALRRWYLTILNLVTLVALAAALMLEPIIVAVFALGPVFYFIWANARWSVLPMVELIEDECYRELSPAQRRELAAGPELRQW